MSILNFPYFVAVFSGFCLISVHGNHEPIEAADAGFELVGLKSSTTVLNSIQQYVLHHISHSKALLILYWQQRGELNNEIPPDFKLKLNLRWMNCSQYGLYLNKLPSQNISIVYRELLINLYDYECVPDDFRNWCADEPGRELSFTYVVEKRFGHSMRMEFVCDPNIERVKEAGGSWSYGVALALIVVASFWAIRMYRKRSQAREEDELVDPEQSFPFKQDPNFLTVPLRVRPRTEDSGKRLMASRAEFELREKTRALTVVVVGSKQDDEVQRRKLQKIEVPKIFVHSPDS
ncbi:unnamed protein product [Caenorhabditis brenneri]